MITHTILLAAEAVAKEGGLFDFNATLPVMAIQFIVLAALLNTLFYKPLGKMIDDRDEYIRSNSLGADDRLDEAQKLTKQFEADLADTRRQAQAIIAQSRADAQKIASEKIAVAQQQAQAEREKASAEIEQQKQTAFSSLEQEVDALSQQILTKLLGAELVK